MRGGREVPVNSSTIAKPFALCRYARSSIVMNTESIWNHNCQRGKWIWPPRQLSTKWQLKRTRKADTRSNDEFESEQWGRVHTAGDDRGGFVGGCRDGHDVRVKRQISAGDLSNGKKSG